jgi:hypothetical protein
MPYCSLEEAWAPVSYKKSDVYDKDGDSIYPELCATNEPAAAQNQRIMKPQSKISRMPLMKEVILQSSGGGSTDNESNQMVVSRAPLLKEKANDPTTALIKLLQMLRKEITATTIQLI